LSEGSHNISSAAVVAAAPVVAVLMLLAWSASASAAGGTGTVARSGFSEPATRYDTSPPLRTLQPGPISGGPTEMPLLAVPPLPSANSSTVAKDTSGAQPSSPSMPSTIANFEGISEGAIPPDPSGAAGLDQYVEIVNRSMDVYTKGGSALLEKPIPTKTLWQGFGGACESPTINSGDGTVLFDSLANRWVVQQFAQTTAEPNTVCVAVSASSDATGSWHRYSFNYSSFPDYTKMGVWPDAYYASSNLLATETETAGPEVCAFDRSAMLTGAPATKQCFRDFSGASTLLPATLDGSTPPPVGEPEWFVALSGTEANALAYWKFHVDWNKPANSTLTGPNNLPVQPFSAPAAVSIPQAETAQKLSTLNRLMYRLAYRNFGDHEAMVVTHAISAGSSVGMRWYELRPSGGSLTVYQEGTYAPDSAYRWTGSIAMDQKGDMALGYSTSSSSLHPSIRYTGRLVSDPLGTMPQPEATLYAGGGSQTGSYRWGDYTEMTVDPVDGCTFWYVNEYVPSNGAHWHTRIGSFKFPTCGLPKVSTESATGITAHEAVLHGSVNPNGSETRYHFEYGKTTSYGSSVPVPSESVGSGTEAVAKSKTITGLSPETTYHYRVVAENSEGTSYGQDQEFISLAVTPSSLYTFGNGKGTGNGQFEWARGIAVDQSGDVWVSDYTLDRIEEFNENGEYLRQFGSEGTGNGQFIHPRGIAVTGGGNLWVVDTGNHRIQEFNSKGEFVSKFGTSGSGNGQFSVPLDVAIAPDGSIWVADTGNDNVQKFTASGEFILSSGSNGSGNGQFNNPTGIAAESDGSVWVVDQGNDRMQKLSSGGSFLAKFGSKGSGAGQFEEPTDVVVKSSGNLLVTDGSPNHRVEELSQGGQLLAEAHEWLPEAIALGRGGRFFIPMGSYRLVNVWSQPAAPEATTGAASSIKTTEATLNASINPSGASTTYHFEYGKTTSYGSSVPVPSESVGSGTEAVAKSKTITGLSPETTYHYRVVAENSEGTSYGQDEMCNTP